MPQFQKITINRRTLLKTGVAVGALQIAAPYIVKAQGEQPIKIGVDNPLTGVYTALGKNENTGMALAAEQINAKGGILGRKIELVIEDSTSDKTDVAVQKARKLIQSDNVTFIVGNVNSSQAIAMAQVAAELKTPHIVPGGHADAVTGANCVWTTFRVCNTGAMQGNAMAKPLVGIGKKIYIIAQDYAFGHALADGLTKGAKAAGGEIIGTDFFPLGTTDYSATLIKAKGANPDVLVDLAAGDDGINSLKQAVQFGLDKQLHLAGMQQELEVLEGLPPEARVGTWLFEWYWNQPSNVAGVADFVAAIRKSTGKVPTARTWFGFTAIHSLALAANNAKSIEPVKVCHALEGLKLPPEVACQPGEPFYRPEDHQLVPAVFVGHAQAKGEKDPEDLFVVDQVVQGPSFMPPASETGCKLAYPT
ncbi:MAG TPA: ABC transporter substrate-binding protein [Stellaceae bacterium]|jgi:branched-chain amino acid transport system substrate-binding protein|nr:ABC transporter substrate-binding protein [Stellaceae bacterium]